MPVAASATKRELKAKTNKKKRWEEGIIRKFVMGGKRSLTNLR